MSSSTALRRPSAACVVVNSPCVSTVGGPSSSSASTSAFSAERPFVASATCAVPVSGASASRTRSGSISSLVRALSGTSTRCGTSLKKSYGTFDAGSRSGLCPALLHSTRRSSSVMPPRYHSVLVLALEDQKGDAPILRARGRRLAAIDRELVAVPDDDQDLRRHALARQKVR